MQAHINYTNRAATTTTAICYATSTSYHATHTNRTIRPTTTTTATTTIHVN